MRKVSTTSKPGAITATENKEIVNNSQKALECVKSAEKRLKRKLERIEVINGYVMTTDKKKWIKYNKDRERFV